jgi:hypothetical protein
MPFADGGRGARIRNDGGQALHVLDLFHITSHLNQAVDQGR